MDDWQVHASCLGKNTAIWFVEDDENNQATEAKEICAHCPVIRPCLSYALVRGERFGIWGGLNAPRRRRLRQIWKKGDMIALEGAIGEELDSLARFVSKFSDDRPESPQSSCARCGDLIKPGKHPVDRNGPNATCGLPSTYNSGCRCERCIKAKAEYGKIQKKRRSARSPRGESGSLTVTTRERNLTVSDTPTEEEYAIEPIGPSHSLSESIDTADFFQQNGLILPEGLNFDQWAAVGPGLVLMAVGYRWWLGDWIMYGDTAFAEGSSQAIDPSWLAEEDIRQLPNYAWVAKVFPPSERIMELTWTHHRVVAALSDIDDRRRLLKMALEEGLSTRKLSELVKDVKLQRESIETTAELVETAEPTRASGTHRVSIYVTCSKADTELIDSVCEEAREWIKMQLDTRGADEPSVTIAQR